MSLDAKDAQLFGWLAGFPSRAPSRRCFSIALVWMSLLPCFASSQAVAQDTKKRLLQQPVDMELLKTRAKIELELDGELHVEDRSSKDSGGTKSIPLKAKATQDYFETIAFRENRPTAAARHYQTAKIDNWVSGKLTTHTVDPARTTRVIERDGSWEQYCPSEPMDRREVELLRSPINTWMLERILPVEPARTNTSWTLSDEDVRNLLNLEAVHQSSVQAKVTGVENGTVVIDLSGTVQGSADSVPTEIELKGSAHAKPSSQGVLVTWLGVSLKERREISQLRPGFDLTARIQILRQEQAEQLSVDHQQLLELSTTDDPSRWLVKLESVPGKFHAYVDRNWITYLDGSEDSVLRLIENNQSIAQCNIAQLSKMEAGTQLSLEGLEADIRKALGNRFEEIVESKETVTSARLRLLRIEVTGTENEVPVRWIYAHLSNDSGRRIALVFTLAAEHADRLAGHEIQLLDSLRFTDSPAEASAEAKQSAKGPSPTSR